MRYLDPRNDIPFRKIFGTHKRLCISLLNALLPLPDDGKINQIEYRDPDQLPDRVDGKNSIVDVRCVDQRGRTFLVEMQMFWTEAFFERFVFNSAKAYSGQISRGNKYAKLQPVYSLCLLNDIFLHAKKFEDSWHHVFKFTHNKFPELSFDDITLVFIELAKFKSDNRVHNKMTDLWLKFMTGIPHDTPDTKIPRELKENENTKLALSYLEELSYTDSERAAYEHYWDEISTRRTLIEGKMEEASRKGYKNGYDKGIEKGIAEGIEKEKLSTVKRMLECGAGVDMIVAVTGLSPKEIAKIK